MANLKEKLKQSFAFGKKRETEVKKVNKTNLIPVPRGAKKERKRIGQGPGSGMGKTSTRGQKGQKARASSMKRGFEGGQMPIHKRLPKRGFTSIFHDNFQPVNLRDIVRLNLTGDIDPKIMVKNGLIKEENQLIKLLGTGDVTSSLRITTDKCSKSALDKIQKAGGTVQFRPKLKFPKKTEKIKA